ncbi:GGDEF domain-containing protein [Alteromonas sp. 5E99-2]|uniref:GGDEF domain-containing protein n=1 Tax=Alteromonas sp. 5E99-2 TaxID=2817683 RepID=UPI001A997E9C|nr:GGDEF domain-containing protein [Alteromonas sp. 5E99-2]MBO1254570.1 GGDEF domain-containing protein [Alteromonas sp. 5E99-2]
MTNNDSFADSPHNLIFIKRIEQYKMQAFKNNLLTAFGGVAALILCVLFSVPRYIVVIWLCTFLLVQVFSNLVDFTLTKFAKSYTQKMIWFRLRICCAMLTAGCFGAIHFLLPDSAGIFDRMLIMTMAVAFSCTVVIGFQMFPILYMLYCLVTVSSITAYLLLHPYSLGIDESIIYICCIIFGHFFVLQKSLFSYKISILAIQNEIKLENEIVSHIASKKVIRRQAYYDQLTDILNRRGFEKKAEKLIEQQQPFLLVFIDLNKFKSINDTYGHLCGDQVLQVFAKRLKANIKQDDVSARLGGDEFCILLKHQDDSGNLSHIDKYLGRLQEKLCETMSVCNLNLRVSSSMGVVSFPEQAQTLDQLLTIADNRMYQTKSS